MRKDAASKRTGKDGLDDEVCVWPDVPKMKRDIIYVARIGVSTVAKRLTEFSKTKPGKLNAEEFHQEALKMEKMEQALLTHPIDAVTSESSSRCHHLENGAGAFACGMCRNCYLQYLTISGGIFEGTADPPAFVKSYFLTEKLIYISIFSEMSRKGP